MPVPQKLRCRITNIIPHGEQVYTLELVPQNPPVPRFKPGQFLHLALDPYDPSGFWPDSRVFSIASSPRQRDKIQITYSVKGLFTARMEAEIIEGREVWIKMPYGEFIVNTSKPIVLFAGGTGITAFTAFLNDLVENELCTVTLFYGAREPGLLVYRSLVEQCRKNLSGFRVLYFLEKDGQQTNNELMGQLSVEATWQHIPDPLNSDYYLSGPPAMLRNLTTQLRERGIMDHSIHIDAWE